MKSILFVCSGNICRSPTAEGIARARAEALGLDLLFDSAGTEDYHVGQAPDARSRQIARERGTPIDALRARQISVDDFHRFDLILAADRGHLRELSRLAPASSTARVELQLPWCGIDTPDQVPDPYYGPVTGFTEVYELLERATAGLLARLRAG
ncbi:MAG: low molecular weight protein-tyrosine-phosphatase [Lysobacterales bacterium]